MKKKALSSAIIAALCATGCIGFAIVFAKTGDLPTLGFAIAVGLLSVWNMLYSVAYDMIRSIRIEKLTEREDGKTS